MAIKFSKGSDRERRGNSHGQNDRNRQESDNDEMDESGISEDDDDQGAGLADNEDGEGMVSSDDGEMDDDEEEDSSDMEVSDCDRRRYEFMDEMYDLESQFVILREQLYRERLSSIDSKLEDIRSGTASEYLIPLERLKEQKETRIAVASIQKDLYLANVQCKFEAENYSAEQNFKSERELLFDTIKAELEEKIRKLEEDKNNVDFSSGLWEQSACLSKATKMKRYESLDTDRRKKSVAVSGPFIIYMIKDSDIMDDWTLIKKSLQQQRVKKAE